MVEEKSIFWRNICIVFSLISVLWVVFILQFLSLINTAPYGNWPQHVEGLKGIIFSPFIHGSFEHLVSNTLPILVLLTVLLNAYPRLALPVLVFIHVASGTMVWLLAPEHGVHIGISGIIYGIAGFLVASGIFRKDRTAVLISIFVVLLYGGMVAGFVPTQGVSWQSHLYGAMSGIFIAYLVRNKDTPASQETETQEVEKHFFDEE